MTDLRSEKPPRCGTATNTARHRFDAETWVGLGAIAANLGRGKDTVRLWIRTKAFPAFQVDGRGPWILLVSDLIEWFGDQKRRKKQES